MLKQIQASDAKKFTNRTFFATLAELYSLKELRVLVPFVKDGTTLVEYQEYVDPLTVECWAGNPDQNLMLHEMGFDNVKEGDAYMLLKHAMLDGQKFDMIDIDTPQGIHKDWQGNACTEHFRFFKECLSLLEDKGLITFTVNKNPYDRKVVNDGKEKVVFNHMHWLAARSSFYGYSKVTEEEALAAYRHVLEESGFELVRAVVIPCFSEVEGAKAIGCRVALEVSVR